MSLLIGIEVFSEYSLSLLYNSLSTAVEIAVRFLSPLLVAIYLVLLFACIIKLLSIYFKKYLKIYVNMIQLKVVESRTNIKGELKWQRILQENDMENWLH